MERVDNLLSRAVIFWLIIAKINFVTGTVTKVIHNYYILNTLLLLYRTNIPCYIMWSGTFFYRRPGQFLTDREGTMRTMTLSLNWRGNRGCWAFGFPPFAYQPDFLTLAEGLNQVDSYHLTEHLPVEEVDARKDELRAVWGKSAPERARLVCLHSATAAAQAGRRLIITLVAACVPCREERERDER